MNPGLDRQRFEELVLEAVEALPVPPEIIADSVKTGPPEFIRGGRWASGWGWILGGHSMYKTTGGGGFANALAGLSLLLAVVALLFLTFWTGYYDGEEVTADGALVRKTSASLIEENGMEVLGVLAVPVVLAAMGFLASFARSRVGAIGLWTTAVLLGLFGLGTAVTVGVFYWPAALTLLTAAIISTVINRRRHRRGGVANRSES